MAWRVLSLPGAESNVEWNEFHYAAIAGEFMTIQFDVPNPITEFIRAQMLAGGFKSEGDYLLDLVERDRERAAKEELEMELLKSLDSGPGVVVTPEFWKQKREELQKRIDSGEFNRRRLSF